MGLLVDLVGKRFGRLTVQERASDRNGRVVWLCKCLCGSDKEVAASALKSKLTRSCGCLKRETGPLNVGRKAHGKTKTPEHNSWWSMICRCRYPNSASYMNYGGRGIKVCEEWKDFERFLKDMGPRPAGTTLDRIDPDGDYELRNCRWATVKDQNNNLRRNVNVTHKGKTQTVAAWAEELGMHRSVLRGRLARGWTLDDVERVGSKDARKLKDAKQAQNEERLEQ